MAVIATILLLLGLVGLLLPVLPGIPFLVLAALLFTADAPGLRRRLLAHPKLAFIGRWQQRLTGWLPKR